MVTVKIHLNSIVSTKGARYCTIDLKDFYLNTPMARPEFMRMKLADLPKEFARIYKLHDLANTNGFISIKIQKGMYGLPQAGILAQELPKKRLNKHGYCQSPITQAYGNTIFARYPSHSALTTLASNMSAMNTLSTSLAS
jgi:hypothetical protein